MSDEQRQPKRHRVVKSTVVDHSYTDLANSPFHKSDAKTLNFPAKLHEIVSTPSYQNIIGWLPHGRSWEVKNRELFISVVLTAHFNHNNFESFNRQVNFWGFKLSRSLPSQQARSDSLGQEAQEWRKENPRHSSGAELLSDAFSSRYKPASSTGSRP
ncbi:hypothetical protein ACHAXN_008142 [Cyclotella atomus]